MVEAGDEDVSEAERIASGADRRREAWGATLEEMDALADEFEADGWRTLRIAAGDCGPFGPSAGAESEDGDGDENENGDGGEAFGLAYVVPSDDAEEVSELFERASFPEYEVYRAENDGLMYTVTALFAPDIETAVFVAGAWELRNALGCATAAAETGLMYTRLQKLDGTVVGVVEHEEPEKFFPDLDAVRRHASGAEAADVDASDDATGGAGDASE
jgi:hypothetical protein